MTIEILASKMELSPAIKSYIEAKVGSLGKFTSRFERGNEARVSVEVARTTKRHRHGEVFYAEATMSLLGVSLRAECTDADLYAAIDGMKDVLKRDIEKFRDHEGVARPSRSTIKKG